MTVAGEVACQTGIKPTEQWRPNWGVEWAQQNARGIGQILKAWGSVRTDLPSDAAVQAARIWKKTAEIGLIDIRDSYFLATCSLGLGIDIAQHPAVKELIQQVNADFSLCLSRCLRSMSEQELKDNVVTRQDG